MGKTIQQIVDEAILEHKEIKFNVPYRFCIQVEDGAITQCYWDDISVYDSVIFENNIWLYENEPIKFDIIFGTKGSVGRNPFPNLNKARYHCYLIADSIMRFKEKFIESVNLMLGEYCKLCKFSIEQYQKQIDIQYQKIQHVVDLSNNSGLIVVYDGMNPVQYLKNKCIELKKTYQNIKIVYRHRAENSHFINLSIDGNNMLELEEQIVKEFEEKYPCDFMTFSDDEHKIDGEIIYSTK